MSDNETPTVVSHISGPGCDAPLQPTDQDLADQAKFATLKLVTSGVEWYEKLWADILNRDLTAGSGENLIHESSKRFAEQLRRIREDQYANPTAGRGEPRTLHQATATDPSSSAPATAPCVGRLSFPPIAGSPAAAQAHWRQLTREEMAEVIAQQRGRSIADTPPMPSSAERHMLADRMSDAIIALINSSPRSPRKDEIVAVVMPELALFFNDPFVVKTAKQPAAVGTHQVRSISPPGFLDQDGQVAAFAKFVQFDGPKMRYYELGRGAQVARYTYQTFAWQSYDPAKLVAKAEALGKQIADGGGEMVIWRVRPEITKMDNGKYAFYCRLNVMPCVTLYGEKREGEETPEA